MENIVKINTYVPMYIISHASFLKVINSSYILLPKFVRVGQDHLEGFSTSRKRQGHLSVSVKSFQI